jgi:2,4-dienoyl-CoA reductase-like NADH-dependent reductase (Old Yellow Enzyme family)
MPHDAFAPARLGGLQLRNRLIKTATYEGMSPGGVPSERLVGHHRDLARGGVGMTTVAYCSVSPDGRTFEGQLYVHDAAREPLRRLTDAVHGEGGAASLQLGHCGNFSKNKQLQGRRPLGPSFTLNEYGLMSGMPFADGMSERQIAETVEDFGRAAAFARDVGFDAVEVHLGHGYLLSQFLSPAVNKRKDRYGGSLENRMRFPLEVLRRVREVVGPDFPILTKSNLRDGFRGGLEVAEAVEVAKVLEREGVDCLVLSGGFTAKNGFYMMRGDAPIREMIEVEKNPLQKLVLRFAGKRVIRAYPFEEMFFRKEALRVREAVRMPVALLGGIVSRANVEAAMRDGFDFAVMGRALIFDPGFVRTMEADPSARSGCDHCNQCVAEMDRGGVHCVRPDAPGHALPVA